MAGGVNRLDFQPQEVGRQIAAESRPSWKTRAQELVFRTCMPGSLAHDDKTNTARVERLGVMAGEQLFNQGLDSIASGDVFQGAILAGIGRVMGVVAEVAQNRHSSHTLQAKQYGFGEYSTYAKIRDTMLTQAGFGDTLGRSDIARNRAFDKTQESLYKTMMNGLLTDFLQ